MHQGLRISQNQISGVFLFTQITFLSELLLNLTPMAVFSGKNIINIAAGQSQKPALDDISHNPAGNIGNDLAACACTEDTG